MSRPRFLNLACGACHVDSAEWLNLDYTPLGPAVVQADLLGPLPLADASMDMVYSSHFIEHVPRARVAALLAECHRVLRHGGLLRLVVPDLLEMCGQYVQARRGGEHAVADRLVLEILDQCVRKRPGGELAQFYDAVRAGNDAALRRWVFERSGEMLTPPGSGVTPPARLAARLASALQRRYIGLVCRLLPRAFREQNVSLAEVGELHAWLYDAHSLGALLQQAGFGQVQVVSFDRSSEAGIAWAQLDAGADGQPRKGHQSLYLEARA